MAQAAREITAAAPAGRLRAVRSGPGAAARSRSRAAACRRVAAAIAAAEVLCQVGPRLADPPTAIFDAAGRYRYELTRTWSPAPPWVWCMLNPSTADALTNDQTISRCCRFAQDGGAGGIVVVNLFGWRATDPADLARQADPAGALADAFILRACTTPGRVVVAAWGRHGPLRDRAAAVTRMLTAHGVRLYCLGTTNNGQPLHPSRLPAATRLAPYGEGPGA